MSKRQDKQRVAALRCYLEENSVLNDWEPTEVPTPRYLVIEKSGGDRIWAYQAKTPQEAAELVDSSDTERVDEVIMVDLDTGYEYVAVRQVVKFSCYEYPAIAAALDVPMEIQIEVKP